VRGRTGQRGPPDDRKSGAGGAALRYDFRNEEDNRSNERAGQEGEDARGREFLGGQLSGAAAVEQHQHQHAGDEPPGSTEAGGPQETEGQAVFDRAKKSHRDPDEKTTRAGRCDKTAGQRLSREEEGTQRVHGREIPYIQAARQSFFLHNLLQRTDLQQFPEQSKNLSV
jgi:hypothetical protein